MANTSVYLKSISTALQYSWYFWQYLHLGVILTVPLNFPDVLPVMSPKQEGQVCMSSVIAVVGTSLPQDGPEGAPTERHT